MADDAQLLRRYAETRSEADFAALVERHLALVYHTALRRLETDSHLAEDVTQGVFTLLAARARSLTGHTSLAGWLHTTTHFKVSEVRRAEHRRRSRETAAHLMQEILNDAPAAADWDRLRPVLDDVLMELNHDDREAVLLRFFEGRAYAEIGERLALPEKSAHKRVERALDKLRDRLARRGIASSAAALAACLGPQAALAAPTGLAASVASAAIATPVAATAFTLISFMTTLKATATVAALGLAATLALYEIRADRDSAAALASARSENAALSADLQSLQARTLTTQKENSHLAALRRPAPALSAVDTPPKDNESTGPQDGRAFLVAHPEVRTALAANVRANNLKTYAALFSALHLSPEQIDEFIRIQSLSTRSVVGKYLASLGDAPLSGSQRTEQLRALLGEAGFQQYREYDRSSAGRRLAEELASSVYFTAAPLTATQAGQLQEIFRNVINPDGSNSRVALFDHLPPTMWDDILTRAAGTLPAIQLAALRDLRLQAVFDQKQAAAVHDYYRNAAAAQPVK